MKYYSLLSQVVLSGLITVLMVIAGFDLLAFDTYTEWRFWVFFIVCMLIHAQGHVDEANKIS